MISPIGSYSTASIPASTVRPATGTASETKQAPDASQPQSSSAQTISTLARQLAASADRADDRDKKLTRSELSDKAKTLLNQVQGDAYFANKAKHDSEVPNTSDPELLKRAKQATEFVNSAARGGTSEKNPFSGLSREQLANIIYDDSGNYTINERRAASYEAYNQEEAWREKVIAKGMAEYNSTGKMTNFFKSVLSHYQELPAIEQAQYPASYAADLENKIKLDFNFQTHRAEGDGFDPASIFETLFKRDI